MRSKKLLLNIGTSLMFQVIVMISGLIVPRLIIGSFGPEVHGLVVSITRFLAYIGFLELGVGTIMRASLYKPLAQRDTEAVSEILASTQFFFRRVAYVFVIYTLVLAAVFPLVGASALATLDVFTLVIVMSIGTFFHYYLGFSSRTLLYADQRNYVVFVLDSGANILQTAVIILAVLLGAGIHVVQFLPLLISVVISFVIYFYVKRRYQVDSRTRGAGFRLKNDWATGKWIHASRFVIEMTPVTVLTLLTNFVEVSVYIVHNLVIVSMRTLMGTVTQGFESALGNMIAKEEYELLNQNFNIYELMVHLMASVLLTGASFLIPSFIALYTQSISDIDYQRPLFAQLLIASVWLYCVRLPYRSVIVASGAFTELKNSMRIEVLLNVVVSVVCVYLFGIVGVAFGAITAVGFQLISFLRYLAKHILQRQASHIIKRCLVSLFVVILILTTLHQLPLFKVYTYVDWIKLAIVSVVISTSIAVLANLIFYTTEMQAIYTRIKTVVAKRT